MMKKMVLSVLCLTFSFVFLYADGMGIGADAAYPLLEKDFKSFPIKEYEMYCLSDTELEQILGTAADIQINLFELLDCLYRYLQPRNMRVEITGSSFRHLQSSFDYGEERVLALFPVHKLVKVQTGACFSQDQKAFDMYLDSKYTKYIEIGTALYEPRCGFEKLEPLTFSEAYGMQIKKWGMVKKLSKIYHYENGKGAIYVKGFFRPKRWRLWLIKRIPKTKAKKADVNTESKKTIKGENKKVKGE